jgi:hypothetical protein
MKKLLLLAAFGATFFAGYAFSRLHGSAEAPHRRVTGIGGIFFKCKDPKKLKEWYNTHLGLNTDAYGTLLSGGRLQTALRRDLHSGAHSRRRPPTLRHLPKTL